MRVILAVFFVVCIVALQSASAAPAWYYGKIYRVYLYHSGFIVVFDDNAVLAGCTHLYAYFQDSQLGEKTVDRAYSMAIAAQQSNATFGIVLDVVPGTQCNSNGSVDIKLP